MSSRGRFLSIPLSSSLVSAGPLSVYTKMTRVLAHLQVHGGVSAPQRRLEEGLSKMEITGDGNSLEAFPEEVSEHFQGSRRVGGGKSPGSQQRLSAQRQHWGSVFHFDISRHGSCSANLGGAQQAVIDRANGAVKAGDRRSCVGALVGAARSWQVTVVGRLGLGPP